MREGGREIRTKGVSEGGEGRQGGRQGDKKEGSDREEG